MSPAPNRVDPFGQIVAIDQRGLYMGNRGSIHREPQVIARPWQVRRWITCRLEYKGWVAPKWVPGRWTPLFFWDEAVALAAGHRPCALCRRGDYNRWLDAWESAFGERPRADPMDLRMHADRLDGKAQRRHARPWADLPAGTFVARTSGPGPAAGSARHGWEAFLVLGHRLVPWTTAGYGAPIDRPVGGEAEVLTPSCTVDVIRHGYPPVVHASVPSG